jgi:serine/threonine protein kinase
MEKKINLKYKKLEKIGEGSYGVVYKVYNNFDSNIYAIKKTKVQNNEGISCITLREISILTNINHDNIIK